MLKLRVNQMSYANIGAGTLVVPLLWSNMDITQ